MSLLETIQIRDGKWMSLPYHQQRMERSCYELFGKKRAFDLSITVPHAFKTGIVKCRIHYATTIEHFNFERYEPPAIHSLKLVHDNMISYPHKFADRSKFTELMQRKGKADDIIIIKGGFVTDCSFGNLVFRKGHEYYTPANFLLNGTRRQQLLSQGLVSEKEFTKETIYEMDSCIIINAMLGLRDGVGVDVSFIS